MLNGTYLVVHDYGSGGLWAILRAPSPSAIDEKFREVKLVSARPEWMTDEVFAGLLAEAQDFDDPDLRGWLSEMRK